VPKVDVPPTKSSLLVIRRNLTFAQEGYELLEQKRQILVLELMRRVEAARTAQEEVDRAMAAAFEALRLAAMRSGTETLARESLGIRREHHLEAHSRSVMGTDIPAITFRHVAAKPEFSLGAGSALSDDAMRRFTEALDAVARLAYEVRRTQRRVNALEKIFIPDYKETVTYIQDVLDEREREQLVVMKMAKRNL
jgi:V/A-type H+-transporting ATPase subunit D